MFATIFVSSQIFQLEFGSSTWTTLQCWFAFQSLAKLSRRPPQGPRTPLSFGCQTRVTEGYSFWETSTCECEKGRLVTLLLLCSFSSWALFVLNLILNSSVPGLSPGSGAWWVLVPDLSRSCWVLFRSRGILGQFDPAPSLYLEVVDSDSGTRASSSSLEVAGSTTRSPVTSLTHCCLAARVCN